MGLAERYLWWRAMKALLIAAPAFVAVMTLTHAQPVFEYYSRSLVGVGELLYLLALWLPMMVYLSMPLIAALAVGYAYAVSLQDREIAVLRAAGMSTRRLIGPGVAAALASAVFCGFMSLYVLPEAFLEFNDRIFLAEKNAGPRSLRENQFTEVKPGVEVYFEERISADAVRNVLVLVRDGDSLTVTTGRVALFKRIDNHLNIIFKDGYLARSAPRDGEPNDPNVVHFATNVQDLARVYSTADLAERQWGFFERHIGHLLSPPAGEKLSAEDRAGWMMEGYKRILHPVLCVVYVLAAMAIAMVPQYGRRAGPTEIVARIAAFLIALHPAYLVGIGVMGRTPAIDTRIAFLYPAAIGAAAIYLLLFLERRGARVPVLATTGALTERRAAG